MGGPFWGMWSPRPHKGGWPTESRGSKLSQIWMSFFPLNKSLHKTSTSKRNTQMSMNWAEILSASIFFHIVYNREGINWGKNFFFLWFWTTLTAHNLHITELFIFLKCNTDVLWVCTFLHTYDFEIIFILDNLVISLMIFWIWPYMILQQYGVMI